MKSRTSASDQPVSGEAGADRPADETRSRRSILAAAAAAVGAVAAEGIVRPTPVAAASVVLGAVNTTTKPTTFRNTAADPGARALIGQVTTTIVGPSTAGVQGQSNAADGRGVVGIANSGGAARGVLGRTLNGVGVYGGATGGTGVQASSDSGIGVVASGGSGSYGIDATGSIAIRGVSSSFMGIAGEGAYYGVIGYGPDAVIGNGATKGVWGQGTVEGATGVFGEGGAGASYAGDFSGNARVSGDLEVGGTVTSVIDHPSDPANRTLAHASVEAPEVLDIYRGTVTLDARGNATVRLPGYVALLHLDFGYQLTPIGAAAPDLHVAREIERNTFRIAGGAPGQKVCWVVTAVRSDAWTRAHPFRVDRLKRAKDRGRYLNPELFGKPRSAGINRASKMHRPPGAPDPTAKPAQGGAGS